LIQLIIAAFSWTISLGIVFKTNILTVWISPVLSKYLCSNGTTSGDDPNNNNNNNNKKIWNQWSLML